MPLSTFRDQDDAQVWAAFKNGDEAAYAYMYNQYFQPLYNYGRHITRNEALVEDCIQDLFIYLLKHREKLADVHSIKYYLFRSLRHSIHAEIVRQGKYSSPEYVLQEYDFEVADPHESDMISNELEQRQRKLLLSGVHELPKRQKEALFLIFYEGLSYKEAASIMSLEVKTLYNSISNALTQLKKHVDGILLLLLTLFVTG